MLHANKVWQPKQGEEIDLSDATLGEKNKINLYNEALEELRGTQPAQPAAEETSPLSKFAEKLSKDKKYELFPGVYANEE